MEGKCSYLSRRKVQSIITADHDNEDYVTKTGEGVGRVGGNVLSRFFERMINFVTQNLLRLNLREQNNEKDIILSEFPCTEDVDFFSLRFS